MELYQSTIRRNNKVYYRRFYILNTTETIRSRKNDDKFSVLHWIWQSSVDEVNEIYREVTLNAVISLSEKSFYFTWVEFMLLFTQTNWEVLIETKEVSTINQLDIKEPAPSHQNQRQFPFQSNEIVSKKTQVQNGKKYNFLCLSFFVFHSQNANWILL